MTLLKRKPAEVTSRLLLLASIAVAMNTVSAQQSPPDDDQKIAADSDIASPAPIDSDNADALARLNEKLAQQRLQGNLDEALQTAEEIAVITEREYSTGHQLIEPLRTVAELQMELLQGGAAEITLTRLIRLIESTDNVFSIDLVEPLTQLAQLQAANNRREDAVVLLRRARHITHRNLGILNLEQIEISEHLADNYFRMGKIEDGSRENRFAFRVNIHEHGEDSADLVPAINRLAAWYERIGEFSIARRYYKESIELIEKDHGVDDLRLVDTLQRIAKSYQKQRIYKGDGQKALIRAVELHEQQPQSDQISYANSLTELGDWFMATSRRDEAIELYQQAWNILTADGANPDRGAVLFGKPKRLRYDPPIPAVHRLQRAAEIYVDVEFLVTAEGQAEDIEVIASTADWRTQSEVRSAMRRARFRPKLDESGTAVAAKTRTRWTYNVPEHLRRRELLNKPTETSGFGTR